MAFHVPFGKLLPAERTLIGFRFLHFRPFLLSHRRDAGIAIVQNRIFTAELAEGAWFDKLTMIGLSRSP